MYNYGVSAPRALISFHTSTGETKGIVVDVAKTIMSFYLIGKEMEPEQLLSLDIDKVYEMGTHIATVNRFAGEGRFKSVKVLGRRVAD